MRVVTHRATLSQRFMLEDKRPRLFPMTLRAILIQPRHREPACLFENVAPMRVMALNAIHVAFHHRMMLGHSKFRLRLQMTLKTRRRIFPRVHNEFPTPAAGFDMLAPRAVARFATRLPLELRIVDMDTRMRTGRKNSRDVRMALRASTIPDVSRSRNFRRRNYRPSQGRTGNCEEHNKEQCAESRRHGPKSK